MKIDKTRAELENKFDVFMELSAAINKDFMDVFMKHAKQDPRIAFLVVLSTPVNLLMKLIELAEKDKELKKDIFENLDVPGTFIRMMKPMEKLQSLWGKIPTTEFMKRYREEYNKQQKEVFGAEASDFMEEQEEFYKKRN